MAKIKKTHTSGFKFKVALAAIMKEYTLTEMSQKFKVHCSQISNWRKHLLDYGPLIFEKDGDATSADKKLKEEIEQLYEQIGRLSVERDFLKKTLDI